MRKNISIFPGEILGMQGIRGAALVDSGRVDATRGDRDMEAGRCAATVYQGNFRHILVYDH